MTTATRTTRANNKGTRLAPVAVLVGSLFAGSFAVAPVVSAQEAPSIVVKYSDLDLSTSDGVRTLYKRITAAASVVCPYEDARQLAFKAINQSCRDAAVQRAVRSIHNAELAAISDQHAKRG
jgi:UrcA family protein